MKKDIPNKEEIIKAARIAFADDNSFWAEVDRLMEKRAKQKAKKAAKVESRPLRGD